MTLNDHSTTPTNASDASERICACGCGRKLEPKRSWQIYASAKCRRYANSKSCSIRKEVLKKVRYHLNEAMETLRELEK